MDLTDCLPILSALRAHAWLAATVLFIAILRKCLGPSSTLLPTISPEKRNVISASLAMVYGAVSAIATGQPAVVAIVAALVAGVAGGFLDALVTLFFAHKAAPAWIKIPLRILDDVAQAEANKPQDPPAPPPIVKPLIDPRDVLPKLGGAALLVLGAGVAVSSVEGCKDFTLKQAENYALTAVDTACLINNVANFTSDQGVLEFCKIAPPLLDEAKHLLPGARIAATHSVGAPKCDAGAK